jgi:hypothetical protein
MAFELGPGGRFVLVAAGLALAWFGFDRAGLTPASWPHPLPPPAREARRPAEALPSPPVGPAKPAPSAFAFPGAPCVAAARAAVPRYRTAPAGLDVMPVGSGPDALARLGAGEADVALVTVSELVAGWDRASARGAPRIAAVAGGSGSGLAVSLRIADELALETARIAAVPDSAEAYLAQGTLARAGTRRYFLVAAADTDDALGKLARGEVDGAAAPRSAIEPLVAAGRARLLAVPAPLDPAVWVVAGGCRPSFPVGGDAVLDLPAAWAAARRLHPGGASPADLLGILDRPLLRAFLAAGGPAEEGPR